jgi:hypothetical protein
MVTTSKSNFKGSCAAAERVKNQIVVVSLKRSHMHCVRVRLSWFVGVWLACQAVMVLTGPVSLLAAHAASDQLCTCPGGVSGQTCPMHRGHHQDAGDESRCVIRSASAQPDAVFAAVFGSMGMMPIERAEYFDTRVGDLVPTQVPHLRFRAELPDPPPPRG